MKSWNWLVDEAIPKWVKKTYSPKASWKDKPFAQEDVRFFFKGIEELSELFTNERPKALPPYFQHPKYRSSYLLYFLPLQAAKFLTLFQLYPKALDATLHHARKTGVCRIVDLGAGPGTASLSFLIFLLDHPHLLKADFPLIELTWFDTNPDILIDGKALVEQMADHFPILRDRVQVRFYVEPWWKAPSFCPQDLSLVLSGHVLNEAAPRGIDFSFWNPFLKQIQGGGALFVEPALKKSAQVLSSLRNQLFDSELIEKTPQRIWGPCLHAETCPLSEGRDWCHFSSPSQISGKWFKLFSQGLGSERQWLKFSHLWLASKEYPAPLPAPSLRRVISDPMRQGYSSTVLICEPERSGRWTVSGRNSPRRGDLIRLKTPDSKHYRK